jgi:uncharacterized protein (TIGR02266 family)
VTSTAHGEKRASPRTPVQLTAHCRLGNRYVKEAVGDLSEGGLFLRTREVVKEGTAVRVAVALPLTEGPRICTLIGHVVNIHKDARGQRLGVGVVFESQEIASLDQLALSHFLARARADGRSVQVAI